MRTVHRLTIALFLALAAVPALAQVSLGGLPVGLPGADRVLGPVLGETTEAAGGLTATVSELAEDRLQRIDRLMRRNRAGLERDARGEPARRGELLAINADSAAIAAAEAAGFSVLSREVLDELGLEIARFAVPRGATLAEAQADLERIMPQADVAADNLYFQSGGAAQRPAQRTAGPAAPAAQSAVAVGIIDGTPASTIPVTGMRGFADGAGVASDHGSAIASLLRANGSTRIFVADVYGTDRAGGNALAIARALGWLAGQGARVVTVSLVGPNNPVVSRAVAAVQGRGVLVVAAVGNDGPAAPPAFPASYDGVVAVTAVDGRERALIEAGRAAHLDYAAPGADIHGLNRRGRTVRLRGTSYATPLVAARVAAALQQGLNWRSALNEQAIDLGERGTDAVYGRGLVCRGCSAAR